MEEFSGTVTSGTCGGGSAVTGWSVIGAGGPVAGVSLT